MHILISSSEDFQTLSLVLIDCAPDVGGFFGPSLAQQHWLHSARISISV